MSKFVVVKKAPEELEKGCVVIEEPNFLEEVASISVRRPKFKEMTVNYMRDLLSAIAAKYGDEEFNPITSVNVSRYRGVPCPTDEAAHDVILKAIKASYPKLLDNYVKKHIENRPFGTRLIYFVGDRSYTTMFFQNGIDEIKEKDVPSYLKGESKKIVGKPAITDEEASSSDVV